MSLFILFDGLIVVIVVAVFVCLLYTVFFPPKILDLFCSVDVVQVHYMFDSAHNGVYEYLDAFTQPKVYYFKANCGDENNQIIHEVF